MIFHRAIEIKVEDCRLSTARIPTLLALLWEIVVDQINTRLLGSPRRSGTIITALVAEIKGTQRITESFSTVVADFLKGFA